MIGKMDEKPILSFSSLHWDEFDSRSPDLYLRLTVDRDIGFETPDILHTEPVPEEARTERTGSVKRDRMLFLVVLPDIELQARIEATEVVVPSNVVPVGMGNQNSAQFGQSGNVRPKGFVGRLCGIRSCSGVNPDELAPVFRNHEVVFGEFVARQRVHLARYDLADALREKRMSRQGILGKRRGERDGFFE